MNLNLGTNEQLSVSITNGLSGIFINSVPLNTSINNAANSIVGSNSDLSTANTIHGVKAYIDNIAGNIESIINNL